MPAFSDAAAISALPIVDLREIGPPVDGVLIRVPDICRRKWDSGQCQEHYRRLATEAGISGQQVQCPHGFASVASSVKGVAYAITCFVPFPRIGGDQERRMAKQFGDNKISADALDRCMTQLSQAIARLERLERDAIQKQAFALHEIRKLNRSVKHGAERMSAQYPDDRDLLRVSKAAAMMSYQLDVIELLADEALAKLPVTTPTSLYRLFDKCAKILEGDVPRPRIRLHAKPHPHDGPVMACERTLPIIVTCLIENALKYALSDRDIHVVIELVSEHGKDLVVARVTNQSQRREPLAQRIFEKGVRQAEGIEGSGHGLYLASLVAKQHNGSIGVDSRMIQDGVCECTFVLKLPQRQ